MWTKLTKISLIEGQKYSVLIHGFSGIFLFEDNVFVNPISGEVFEKVDFVWFSQSNIK